MKITTLPPESSQPGSKSAAVPGDAARGRSRTAGPRSSDRVAISGAAAGLAKAAATPDRAAADPARIAEIKKAIEEDVYPIQIRALANAILDRDGEL